MQGILGMLSAIWGKQFFIQCYNPVGEMMDMMALTNSAINFILYCLMSSQFRLTGRKILGIRKKQAITSMRRMSVKMEVKAQLNILWIMNLMNVFLQFTQF